MTIDDELRSAINDFTNSIEPRAGSIDIIERRLGRPNNRRWLVLAMTAAAVAVIVGVVATRPHRAERVTTTPASGSRPTAPLLPKRLYKQYDEAFQRDHGPMYLLFEGRFEGRDLRIVATIRSDGHMWTTSPGGIGSEAPGVALAAALNVSPVKGTLQSEELLIGQAAEPAVSARLTLDGTTYVRPIYAVPGTGDGVFVLQVRGIHINAQRVEVIDAEGRVVAEDPPDSGPPDPTMCNSNCPLPRTITAAPGSPPRDGVYAGYIRAVDAGALLLGVDVIQLFWGDDAMRAAKADGGEALGDFWIRNVNPAVAKLPLAADPMILVLSSTGSEPPLGSVESQAGYPHRQVTLNDFAAVGGYMPDDEEGAAAFYWVTIRQGRVVKIEEQWFP